MEQHPRLHREPCIEDFTASTRVWVEIVVGSLHFYSLEGGSADLES